MSRVMENSAQAHEAAATWLARRDSGEWSAEDEAAFEAWFNASTGHRVAFIRLESAWREADRIGALGAGVEPGAIPPRRHGVDTSSAAPASRRWSVPFASAAGIAFLAVTVGIATYLWFDRSPAYRTPVGGLASVPISDGSKVTLNTDSEIRLHITGTERRIDLKHGEAFFDVAKDPARPFVVQAGNKRIVALGTQFSVRRDRDDVRIVVTEGRVRLESPDSPGSGTVFVPGAIAHTQNTKVAVQERPLPEAEELLSWRSGFVVFKETPLAQAAEELNRYNTRQLIVEDASIAGFRIGGTFRSTNLDAFLRLLEQGFGIHAEQQGERIVLARRAESAGEK